MCLDVHVCLAIRNARLYYPQRFHSTQMVIEYGRFTIHAPPTSIPRDVYFPTFGSTRWQTLQVSFMEWERPIEEIFDWPIDCSSLKYENDIQQLHKRKPCSKIVEVQNVHWASKETYHFFRVTLTKIHAVNMNNIWTLIMQICQQAHPKKTKVYISQRGDKCDEITRCQFQKIKETARLSGWEFEADKSRYGVYVTCYWNWMNSYWMFWIGCLRGARSVSSFCDFRKFTFWDFTAFFSFLTQWNLLFFRYSY